jgi:hypothetical protein
LWKPVRYATGLRTVGTLMLAGGANSRNDVSWGGAIDGWSRS